MKHNDIAKDEVWRRIYEVEEAYALMSPLKRKRLDRSRPEGLDAPAYYNWLESRLRSAGHLEFRDDYSGNVGDRLRTFASARPK